MYAYAHRDDHVPSDKGQNVSTRNDARACLLQRRFDPVNSLETSKAVIRNRVLLGIIGRRVQ